MSENKSENKSPAGEGEGAPARAQGDDLWRAPSATPTASDAEAARRRKLRTRWIAVAVAALLLLAGFVLARVVTNQERAPENSYRAGYDFVTEELSHPTFDVATIMLACRQVSARQERSDVATAMLRGCTDALRDDTDRRYGR